MRFMKRSILFTTVLGAIPSLLSASVLMLDFGPTEAEGDSQINSPYHAAQPAFQERCWNTVGVSNIDNGLRYANGEEATGVSLVLGSSIDSAVVDFSESPANSSELGVANLINGPESVFAGSSVGKDGIFTSAPYGNNLVGLKVGGLPAGRYEVYLVGANTSNGLNYQSPTLFFVEATGDVATFDTEGLPPTATSLLSEKAVESWTEGESYAKASVELGAGEFLVIIADGAGVHGKGKEERGFLNAVQIVPVK